MMRKAWLATLLVSLMVPVPSATARAVDPGCDEQTDVCEIQVVIGHPKPVKPGDPKGSPVKKTLPLCSAFSGGTVVVPGTPVGDIPAPDRPKPGWIRITCLSGGAPMWLWMDPGVNAEAIARVLLARLKLQPVTIGWTPKRAGAMGFVGVPTWLWVAEPGRVTWGPATISAGGVSLTARVESMTWSMGNGDEVRCATTGTVWQRGMGERAEQPGRVGHIVSVTPGVQARARRSTPGWESVDGCSPIEPSIGTTASVASAPVGDGK